MDGGESGGALTLIKPLPADAEESCRPALCLEDEHHKSLWSSFNLAVALTASPPSPAQLPSRTCQHQINKHQHLLQGPKPRSLAALSSDVFVEASPTITVVLSHHEFPY